MPSEWDTPTYWVLGIIFGAIFATGLLLMFPAGRAWGSALTILGLLGLVLTIPETRNWSINLLQQLYAVAGAPYPILSLVIVVIVGAIVGASLLGYVWWLLSRAATPHAIDEIVRSLTEGKFVPQPLMIIDTFKQKISEGKYSTSIVVTNRGNAICDFIFVSICSTTKGNIRGVDVYGVVKVSRGGAGGNCVDIVAKDVARGEYGHIDLIFPRQTDVEFLDIKADTRTEYHYKPIYMIGGNITVTMGPLIDLRTGKPVMQAPK